MQRRILLGATWRAAAPVTWLLGGNRHWTWSIYVKASRRKMAAFHGNCNVILFKGRGYFYSNKIMRKKPPVYYMCHVLTTTDVDQTKKTRSRLFHTLTRVIFCFKGCLHWTICKTKVRKQSQLLAPVGGLTECGTNVSLKNCCKLYYVALFLLLYLCVLHLVQRCVH